MAEQARVALLARPGQACDRLRAGLVEAGAELVLEADPTGLSVEALTAVAPRAVVVALEPSVEDIVDRFDSVFGDPGVLVVFEEADIAARREGWDASRWVRHLAAKLHGHGDVLPPGREPDATDSDGVAPAAPAASDPGAAPAQPVVAPPAVDDRDVAHRDPAGMESIASADASMPDAMDIAAADVAALADAAPGVELADGSSGHDAFDLDFSAFDAALYPGPADAAPGAMAAGAMDDMLATREARADVALPDLDVGDFALPELEAALELADAGVADDASAALPALDGLEIDFGAELAQLDDAGMRDMPDMQVIDQEPQPLAFGGLSLTDDINDFDPGMDLGDAPVAPPAAEAPADGLDLLLAGIDPGEAPERAPQARPSPVEAPARGNPRAGVTLPDFSKLSLVEDDAPLAAPVAVAAPAATRDLGDLERRIAPLSLQATEAAAPVGVLASGAFDMPRGAVVIMAGIGGPDAVRQILSALPASFPRPVLISQRLDGGRYDRLVQQMGRAAALPVHLAEAGASADPGHIYILPPDLGFDAGGGLRFIQGRAVLDALPSDDTAVLLLSGADPALVDEALACGARGALVAGQSPDGCYDAAAPTQLAERGGASGTPSELVQQLLQRWPA